MAAETAPVQLPVGVQRRTRPRLRLCTRAAERTFALVGLGLSAYLIGFDLQVMQTDSMSPTLKGNGRPGSDWVLTERVTSWWRGPRRWELAAFDTFEGIHVMKRVIGLPGERVALKEDGTFLVNGQPVSRPACVAGIEYLPTGRLSEGREVRTLDRYFVLGDFSVDSDDSRYNPPVQPARLTGRPWLIVWPPARFGFVNP